MNIYIGTSGYYFHDWKGPFYPETLPNREMLLFYCQYFDTLELNVTHYRLPSIRTMEGIVSKTPPEFNFWIKAHQDITHNRGKNPDVYGQFRECIRPAGESGKLRGVLAQFPFSFKATRENASYLLNVRRQFEDLDLAVEFRHNSWIKPEVFDFLKNNNIIYCIPDEPDLPGLVPPDPHVTSEIAYVRFHGRNKRDWWGEGGDRYNYEYSEDELKEWLEKINGLGTAARVIYLLFNNCHLGQAVRNALTMQQLLLSQISGEGE